MYSPKTASKRLVLACTAAMLAACATPPDLAAPAELAAPQSFETIRSFAAPVSQWPSDGWWRDYGDAQLNALIEEALANNKSAAGFIFDGFPRTVAQAEALDAMLERHGKQIDRVVRLEVDPQKLLDRVAKRFAEEGRADDNPASFLLQPFTRGRPARLQFLF